MAFIYAISDVKMYAIYPISIFMQNPLNVNFLVFMRNTVNVTLRKSIMDDYTCKHWKWPFKTTVPNSNSFVGLSHLISNLRYMGSNMFIFKVWTTFLGERKIRTKFHSANACCELKSRLFDFFWARWKMCLVGANTF